MKKSSSGRPNHKTIWGKSNSNNDNGLDFVKLSYVFIFWGVIGLFTSFHYNSSMGHTKYNFTPAVKNISSWGHQTNKYAPPPDNLIGPIAAEPEEPSNLIGPIKVKKRMEVYQISIRAHLRQQSWSFIEGEVLDEDENYLFSFGKELWYESGRDSEGRWVENQNSFDIKVTFPKPGLYYLNFKTDSNVSPDNIDVTVTKIRGSALPHFWFGVFALIAGVSLNIFGNRDKFAVEG